MATRTKTPPGPRAQSTLFRQWARQRVACPRGMKSLRQGETIAQWWARPQLWNHRTWVLHQISGSDRFHRLVARVSAEQRMGPEGTYTYVAKTTAVVLPRIRFTTGVNMWNDLRVDATILPRPRQTRATRAHRSIR